MLKTLGLGNALVDIMITIPDDGLLEQFKLPKGSMQHVARSLVDAILAQTEQDNQVITSGGSAANAIHGLARLGNKTAFVGKVGYDDLGNFFIGDMLAQGIEPKFFRTETATGTAAALITPDGERTFAVFLGAAVELSENDITPGLFKGFDILHIEGYLVQNHQLIETAVKMAKKHGLMVSLDLASFNVVEENLEFIKRIVKEYVDIVFANEQEAAAFTGHSALEALAIFANHCNIAIVKTGEKGSLVKQRDQVFQIDAIPSQVIDTTGAGDLYAAGFIHGLMHGMTLEKCGKIGTLLAGNVIGNLGAKIPEEKWENIISEINKI